MSLIQNFWSIERKTPLILQSVAPLITAVGALALTSSHRSVTAVPILGAGALLSVWLFRTMVTQETKKKELRGKITDLEVQSRDLKTQYTTLQGQIPDKDAKARVEAEVQRQEGLKQRLTKDNQALLQQVQAAERKLQEAAKTVAQPPANAPTQSVRDLPPQPRSLTAPELFFMAKFKMAKEGSNPPLEAQLSQWIAAETALKSAFDRRMLAGIAIPVEDLPLAYQVACDNQLKTLAEGFASRMDEVACGNLEAGYKKATQDVGSWEASQGFFTVKNVPPKILRQIVERVIEPLMLIGLQRDNEEYFKTAEGAALIDNSWKKFCLKRCGNIVSSLERLVAQAGVDASWEDRYFYEIRYSDNKADILLSVRGNKVRELRIFDGNTEKLAFVLQRCPNLKLCSLSQVFEPSDANWAALAAMSTLETLELWFEPKGLVQGLIKFRTLPMLIFHNGVNLQKLAENGIVVKKLGIPLAWAQMELLVNIEELVFERIDLYRSIVLVKSLAGLKNLKRLCISFDSYSHYKDHSHRDLEQFFLEKGIKLEWGSNREW